MCTAATYKNYFGRNLDLEYSYEETITITPRKFPFAFRSVGPLPASHYAIIGIAFVTPDPSGTDYPLYYDAINEKGLGIAGLNFVGNAKFFPAIEGKANVAPFEFIPWVLGQCASVSEARTLLANMSFLNESFSPELPLSELHWIIADTTESITVESTAAGLQIYDNPVGVLTNNPPFPAQLFGLNNYVDVSPRDPVNHFAPELEFHQYSRGLGSRNLPGGLDSSSRFVRVAFTKMNSVSADDELSNVSQFFHILHSVDQQRGCDDVTGNLSEDSSVQPPEHRPSVARTHSDAIREQSQEKLEITIYSSCYNLKKGLAYYTCYDNHQISCVDLHKAKLDGKKLKSYPMLSTEQVNYQN